MSTQAKKKESLTESVKTIVYALLIAGLFRTLFFQPFFIPSGSMKETMLIGDFLFVNKMSYGYSKWSCPKMVNFLCPISNRILGSEPERGDIVVFMHPTQKVEYVKRLVGLPGDKVQVTNGVVYINGQMSPQKDDGAFIEDYAQQGARGGFPRCVNPAPAQGSPCAKERFVETFPDGHSHTILNILNNNSVDNTATYTVPEDHYFFLGDNRDNSRDSRFSPPNDIGFVAKEYLVGKASRVIFSSSGKRMLYFWTWRKDRFFKKLQ